MDFNLPIVPNISMIVTVSFKTSSLRFLYFVTTGKR